MLNSGYPLYWPAGQNSIRPLWRDRIAPVDGAEKGARDGRIRVGVAAERDGTHYGLFNAIHMQELPERVLERNQYPPHLSESVIGALRSRVT